MASVKQQQWRRRHQLQRNFDRFWNRFLRFILKKFLRFLLLLAFLALLPPIFFHFRLKRFQQMRTRSCGWLNDPPLVCAHGGDSSKAFPNTMSAYRSALQSQVDCIEIDVSRSSDGVLFALHDRDLQRISGNNSAKVGHFSLKEIKSMDARHVFPQGSTDLGVPTVEDALMAVEAKSQQRLSGADRKKLRRIAKERFVNATDADIDLIIPPKSEITAIKFPNRVHVYGIEGGFPMLFDVDGRGADVFPTVYALWKAPNLLPAFTLKGGEVSHFIIGGADLMFPGIRIPEEGLPSFLAGQPWSVKVPGNLAPIAVGSTNMTSAEAVKAGLRGKALLISHCYKDFLWESAEGHYVPNAGFLEDMVLDDPALDSQRDPSNYLANDHQNGVTTGQEGEFPEVANAHSEDLEKNGLPEGIISDLSGLNVEVNGSVEELNGEKEQHALSTDEVDSLLDTCLLQALHTTVKDKDLPMPGSSLWSCHVLPCRPSGITLDIKKSSHKKLSKWLQSKSSVGLISSKEDKHKKEIVLLAINRKHADYMSFRPEKRKVEPIECSSDAKASESAPQKFQLELTEIYKPSVHVNPIFTSLGLDTGRLFTAAEATDVVFSYIENANLVKPTNKAVVVLDAILCDALYKGSIKKGSAYPTEIHKKDLGFTFINRMQAHHRVTRANETVVRKGALKTVKIMTERRQGNKKVTRVWGFESFLIDAESLASELQKKCACSTTVTELPGKKGFEVLIQGGVIGELAKYLVDRYGIPKRYIEVLDKTRR